MSSAYTEDALCDIRHHGVHRGREAIDAMFARDLVPVVQSNDGYILSSPDIVVDGDSARAGPGRGIGCRQTSRLRSACFASGALGRKAATRRSMSARTANGRFPNFGSAFMRLIMTSRWPRSVPSAASSVAVCDGHEAQALPSGGRDLATTSGLLSIVLPPC